MRRCHWGVCPMYPELPRDRETLGWAAVACPWCWPQAGSPWLALVASLWVSPVFCTEGQDSQAAIWCVHKCGRMQAKHSLSPLFPDNYHFLLKLHSWSSSVASDTNMDMHGSLCNCLGDLKHGTCPNPEKGLLWPVARHRCPLSRTGTHGMLCFLAPTATAVIYLLVFCLTQ